MGYYDFPHTRNYDTDLGYLIKRYFELNTDFESLEKNFNDLKAWCIAQLNSEALKTLVANKLDEWLQDGTLASLINNALLHVTTYDTVVEMLTHTGLEIGSKIYCAGADTVNDGDGGHFRIRARLSTDYIDSYHLYLIDGGIKVAERIETNKPGKRKYIFIGDSYNTEAHHGGWGKGVASKLDLSPNDYINSGVGGASFGNSENNFYTQFNQIALNLSSKEKSEITDIVIAGGTNDWAYTTEQIKVYFDLTQNLAKNEFKNAKLWIICIGWSYEKDNIRPGILNAYNSYNICNKYATVINNAFLPLVNRHFLEADMTHPTDAGLQILVDGIVNYLNDGNLYDKKYTDLYSYFDGINIYGDISLSGIHVYKKDSVGLRFEGSPITINHGLGTLIATSDIEGHSQNLFMRNAVIPAQVMYNLSDGSFKDGRGLITIKKRENELKWDMYLSSESIISGDYPVNNVVGIYLIFDCILDITKN